MKISLSLKQIKLLKELNFNLQFLDERNIQFKNVDELDLFSDKLTDILVSKGLNKSGEVNEIGSSVEEIIDVISEYLYE